MHSVQLRTLILGCLVSLLTQLASAYETPVVTATTPVVPQSGIFIGNSFFYNNNSMHTHLRNIMLADPSRLPFRSTSVTISGSGLDWHNVEPLKPTQPASRNNDIRRPIALAPAQRHRQHSL